MVQTTDICVMGGEKTALAVATGAAMLGLKVVLVHPHPLGYDRDLWQQAFIHHARAIGKTKNLRPVFEAVEATQAPFTAMNSPERLEGLGVHLITRNAFFKTASQIGFEDHDLIIEAKRFVIATGSKPFIPSVSGLESAGYMTSDTLSQFDKTPDHVVIYGGGATGVEMAQTYAHLGAQVTLVTRGVLLSRHDPELVSPLRYHLIQQGITVLEHTTLTGVEGKMPALTLQMKQQQQSLTLKASHILLATGRSPSIANIGLAKAGIDYTAGGIKTDARLRTTQAHIFAGGECTGAPPYGHCADAQAGVILKNIAFRMPARLDKRATSYPVFGDTELIQVGLTEKQAFDTLGRGIEILRFQQADNERLRIESHTHDLIRTGLTKVILHKKGLKTRIVGAGMVGHRASDLIQPWVLAIENGLPISALAGSQTTALTASLVNKRTAASYLLPRLFTHRMKKIVRFLFSIR